MHCDRQYNGKEESLITKYAKSCGGIVRYRPANTAYQRLEGEGTNGRAKNREFMELAVRLKAKVRVRTFSKGTLGRDMGRHSGYGSRGMGGNGR